MIAFGALLLMIGIVAYAAGKLREQDGERLPSPHEVERAIERTTD